MKNINRLLFMVVALIGIQSIANAAAAATPLDHFKAAYAQYTKAQHASAGKVELTESNLNNLQALFDSFDEITPAQRKQAIEWLKTQGSNLQSLAARGQILHNALQKRRAAEAAAGHAAEIAQLDANIARLEKELSEILDASAAGSEPASPRGSVIDESAAPSEAGDDDDAKSISEHIGAQPAASAGAAGAGVASARSYPDVIPNSLMQKMLTDRYGNAPQGNAVYPYGNTGPVYRRLSENAWMK